MRVITIGREFGSGGRELGKRLAAALGVPCYDKEIIAEVAKAEGISPAQAAAMGEANAGYVYPTTAGRSFLSSAYLNNAAIQMLGAQQEAVKTLAAQGDCVIVGRFADVALCERGSLNIFVYAEEGAKLARCLARAGEGEDEKTLRREMKRIDRVRARNYKLLSGRRWGDKSAYHLCVNTTNAEIERLAHALAEYARAWFEAQGK